MAQQVKATMPDDLTSIPEPIQQSFSNDWKKNPERLKIIICVKPIEIWTLIIEIY